MSDPREAITAQFRWKWQSISSSVYHDDSGRIHGRIERLYRNEYAAFYEDRRLGEYIGEEEAKRAVVRAQEGERLAFAMSRQLQEAKDAMRIAVEQERING